MLGFASAMTFGVPDAPHTGEADALCVSPSGDGMTPNTNAEHNNAKTTPRTTALRIKRSHDEGRGADEPASRFESATLI